LESLVGLCPEIALDLAEFFFFSSVFLDISPKNKKQNKKQ
jgi:hypothetical protein